MPKASELNSIDKVMMLMKSSPGFGKTIAACSAAVDGPLYLAYWDKKEPTELTHYYKNIVKRPDLLERINWKAYGSWNANEFLNDLILFVKKGCPYVTIVNDSVTFMTSSAVNWSLGFRQNPKMDTKAGDSKTVMQIIPDFDEYKVETGLVTQAIDLCRALPCNIIWTAHPLPKLLVTGSGSSMKVSQTNTIVSVGNKAGAIVPAAFTEIYHFLKETDYSTNPSRITRKVTTDMVGDDFAKTSLNLPREFDITDRLFWEVWKEQVRKGLE